MFYPASTVLTLFCWSFFQPIRTRCRHMSIFNLGACCIYEPDFSKPYLSLSYSFIPFNRVSVYLCLCLFHSLSLISFSYIHSFLFHRPVVDYENNSPESLIIWSHIKLKVYFILWTPIHHYTSFERPAKTYIHQLCDDTRCCPEELPGVMS